MTGPGALPDDAVVLVTGANTGIGRATASQLAARGFRVIVTGRTLVTIETVARALRAHTGNPHVDALSLDLSDMASIKSCATAFLSRGWSLHVLINNAGLSPRPGQQTPAGFEMAFGVNHVGHFVLTSLLLDRLIASAPARVVTVASHAHYSAGPFDWARLRAPTRSRFGYAEYATSKLANVMFSAELARRLAGTGVTTYAVHPGVVASDIWRVLPWPLRQLITLPMISTDRGARTSVYCATDPGAATETGLYYEKSRPRPPSALAQDRALARELWERSAAWVAES